MPGLPRVLESAPQTRLPLTIADQTEPPDGVDAIANRVKEANEMAAQRKILRKQTLTEELGEKRDVILTRLNEKQTALGLKPSTACDLWGEGARSSS